MNVEKRKIVYNKIKESLSNQKKLLRFDLNPNLERKTCLDKDLKLLKHQNFETVESIKSDIRCESYLENVPVNTIQLSEGMYIRNKKKKHTFIWKILKHMFMFKHDIKIGESKKQHIYYIDIYKNN